MEGKIDLQTAEMLHVLQETVSLMFTDNPIREALIKIRHIIQTKPKRTEPKQIEQETLFKGLRPHISLRADATM